MSIPIEDNATDVLRKSMLGRGISSEMIAERSGMPIATIRRLRKRRADAGTRARVALALELCPERLSLLDEKFDACAAGNFPKEPKLPENCSRHVMFCGNKILPEMTANAYALTDSGKRHAVLCDCGMNAGKLVDFLESQKINSIDVCLTHRHFDHADGLRELRVAFPELRVWNFEALFDGNFAKRGFSCGNFRLSAISVPGHTPDSVVFVWTNPPAKFPPIAFTGDTIFLGSVGGCLPGYLKVSIENIRSRIFDELPPETILLPGHGPASVLEREIRENPFFCNVIPDGSGSANVGFPLARRVDGA